MMADLLELIGTIRNNSKLVLTVGTAAALGTIALHRLLSGSSHRWKKRSSGLGPTGNGKWKLYHTHTFRSARCVWLIEGELLLMFLILVT